MMRFGISGFFSDLVNFLRAGSVLGVDIGTNSIKIAEVSQKGGRFRLENYGIINALDYLSRPNLALQTSSLNVVEKEAARLIKIILKDMGTKSKTALASIPTFASFVTLVDMPVLSKQETAQSLKYQARQYIPMPIEQVQVDWLKVDEYISTQGQFQRILLIGIPKKIVSAYKRVFKEAGLRLVAMELDALALVRAFSKFETPTLIVDIGAESTLVVVAEGNFVKYVGQTDYSGVHITRVISQSLGLGMKRAEELKKRRGLLPQNGESELSTLIQPFLDVIIQEVEYIRKLYEERYGKKVAQLMLTGGGSSLLRIEDYFSKRFNLHIIFPDVFANIDYPPEIEPAMRKLRREMPIAIGLASRYFTT